MAAAVSCVGLVKKYDDVIAVNGIDLEVQRGECFGLLGPNGAGKTTTVEVLEGLMKPDEGTVEVLGMSWGQRGDQALRERIGIQLQNTQLADKLTVEEVLRLFRSFYKKGRTVDEVIDLVDLDPKRGTRVHKLSGGQEQRLALACALVSDPDLLFLDEPTTGLDPQARHRIWSVVERFRARGGTVLMTTHYMEEAAHLCDRLAIIDLGKLIAVGPPSALIAELGAEQIIELSTERALDPAELGQLPGVIKTTRRGRDDILHVSEIADALPALLDYLQQQKAPLLHLATHEATLEDVFLHLTGKALRDE